MPLKVVLDRNITINPFHGAFELLIQSLRQEDSREEGVKLIEKAITSQLADNRGAIIEGSLLSVLYLGTLQNEYLVRLHTLSREVAQMNFASTISPNLSWYWTIFYYDWPDKVRLGNATLLSNIITSDKISPEIIPDIIEALTETLEPNESINEYHKIDICREVAALTVKVSLDNNFDHYDRIDAFRLLAELSPYSAVVVVGQIVTKEFSNINLIKTLNEDLTSWTSLSEEIKRIGAPEVTMEERWSAWLRDQGHTATKILTGDLVCGSVAAK